MWHLESLKFISGLDKREATRLPRRPYIKYGQFRTFKKRKYNYPPSNFKSTNDVEIQNNSKALLEIERFVRAEEIKNKKSLFHEECLRSGEYRPFKARPVPLCLKNKRNKKKPNQEFCQQIKPDDFDCTVIFDKDATGNDVCNIQYKDKASPNNYSFDSTFAGYHNVNGSLANHSRAGAENYQTKDYWSPQNQHISQDRSSSLNHSIDPSAVNYLPMDNSSWHYNTVCYPGDMCFSVDDKNTYMNQVYNNPNKFLKTNNYEDCVYIKQPAGVGKSNNGATVTIEYPSVYNSTPYQEVDNNIHSSKYPSINYEAVDNRQMGPGYGYADCNGDSSKKPNNIGYNKGNDFGDTLLIYNNPAFTSSSHMSDKAQTGTEYYTARGRGNPCHHNTNENLAIGQMTSKNQGSNYYRRNYPYINPCITQIEAAKKEAADLKNEQIKNSVLTQNSVGNYPFSYHRADEKEYVRSPGIKRKFFESFTFVILASAF